MQAPETRTIKQCTYTPISLRHSGTDNANALAQPMVKQTVLTIAMDGPFSAAVSSQLSEVQNAQTNGTRQKIIDAYHSIRDGDNIHAISLLGSIPLGDIVNFAKDALNAEQLVLETAKKDVLEMSAN